MMTCQTFFEMLKIPTLLTKNWKILKPPKSEIEVRKKSFFIKFSTLWLPAVEVESTVESTVESSRKNRALHFIRSVGEAATSENSQSGNPVRLPPPAGICVYRVYMCVYIYTVYTDTPHESTKNMYISDIRFLLLAVTSANLQSWILYLFFQSFHAQKERQNIGSRSLWVLSGLSIKNSKTLILRTSSWPSNRSLPPKMCSWVQLSISIGNCVQPPRFCVGRRQLVECIVNADLHLSRWAKMLPEKKTAQDSNNKQQPEAVANLVQSKWLYHPAGENNCVSGMAKSYQARHPTTSSGVLQLPLDQIGSCRHWPKKVGFHMSKSAMDW